MHVYLQCQDVGELHHVICSQFFKFRFCDDPAWEHSDEHCKLRTRGRGMAHRTRGCGIRDRAWHIGYRGGVGGEGEYHG